MLIVLGGLPATGKTTIAQALAAELGAVHVRIDSIEQALRDAAAASRGSGLAGHWGRSLDDAGYRIGYAVAEDNLRLGRTVIADSVNPIPITREAWRGVAARAGVPVLEVEVICSDAERHRRRVDTRASDIPGLELPTWAEVLARDYRPWSSPRLVIDTARHAVDECVAAIREAARCVDRAAGH